ncbi:MAG: septal ring lytic transglycosylase RlpA family protein [Marinilabilia sp.]
MKVSRHHALILVFIAIFVIVLHEDREKPAYTEQGKASYYAFSLQGRPTASGTIFHHDSLTAAHRTLPLGTKLKVVNLENDSSVIVKVNDRGPFVEDRILDLSRAAFRKLAPLEKGIIEVKIEVVER